MRFVSKFAGYGTQVIPPVTEAYATGMSKYVQEGVFAMFQVGALTTAERELAVTHWAGSFNGFCQLEDEVTILPPDYRLAAYDSLAHQAEAGFSDEVRLEIERTLIKSSELTNDLFPVPEDVIPPPWPNYDAFDGTPAELVRLLVEQGHDLEAVLAYERANQDRELVVEGLDELIRHGSVEDAEEVLG